MSRHAKFRGVGWAVAGALALAGIASGAPAAPATFDAAAGGVTGGTPEGRKALTSEERAHIRRLRRQGEEKGLTKAQIRAEIERYLQSIGKEKRVKSPAEVRGTR
jgi:hypothetical protein